MADLIMEAATTYMQHPHVANTVAKCVPEVTTIVKEIVPWSYYMYSIVGGAIAAVVFGVIGYFVGKRGLTGTQTDLTNAETAVKTAESKVATAL